MESYFHIYIYSFTQKNYRALKHTIMNKSIIKSNPKPPKTWYFAMWTIFKLGPNANMLSGLSIILIGPIHISNHPYKS
jgi:hypothetical protein